MIDLRQGDCLELMKDIPNESIDMILCDLPYGTTSCGWDVIIPFDKLWEQYTRIIKDTGTIVLFASQPFTTLLISSNMTMFREQLIWLKNKAGSGLQANQKHIKVHEEIIVFSKKSKYTYNPQKWLVDKKEFLTQRKTFKDFTQYSEVYSNAERTQKKDNGDRNPISIISCRVPFTPSKSKTYSEDIDLRIHPTQKPLKLCEYLIETYSNEGDLVLDNCAGSMTTGVACLNTNRNGIMIEKEEKYLKLGKERIKNRGE